MNNADALEALKRGLSQAKPGEDGKIQLVRNGWINGITKTQCYPIHVDGEIIDNNLDIHLIVYNNLYINYIELLIG